MAVTVRESEGEALRRVRDWMARAALRQAPDLMLHVRSLAVSGKTERGETLPEWSAPMQIQAADDSDALYAQLIDWGTYWAEQLGRPAPSTVRAAWRNDRGAPQGFRPGTTPEGAEHLMRVQTVWLLVRADDIDTQNAAEIFQEDVTGLVRHLNGRYPTAPKPEKRPHPRPCPVCGEVAVMASWSGENDIRVSCGVCGWAPERTTYRSILDWIL